MWAAGFPGAADRPDRCALEDALPAGDAYHLHVCICGLPAVAVIDHHHVAVTEIVPPGVDHNPAVGGPHGFTVVAFDIDRIVVGGR